MRLLVHSRRAWQLPERQATPEAAWLGRRGFLQSLARGALSAGLLAAGAAGCEPASGEAGAPEGGSRVDPQPPGGAALYPARRSARFADAGRPLTPARIAASYNNFYEFGSDKTRVWTQTERFLTRPWT